MSDSLTGSSSTPTLSALLQKDVDLIKSTFKGNEELLKTIRALMFGIPLLDDEKKHIKDVFSDPQVLSIMRRRFLPVIENSRDLPLGQIQDIWLGAEQMVFGAPPLQIEQAMKYKAKAMEFTSHALTLLTNPDAIAVPFTVALYETDPMQIELMARNMFLRHIDQQLMMLNLIANQETETRKEIETRNIMNSAK